MTIPVLPSVGQTLAPDQTATHRNQLLLEAAQTLEATFLSEMLKSAGVGAPRTSFGGGAGEEHFASFLREEQAAEMVKAGGIGLAEVLFNAMKVRSNE